MASCPAASTYHSPLQFLSFPWEIPILSIFTIVIFLFLSTIFPGLSRWLSGKEFICQCRRCGFDSSLDQEDPLEMRKEIHSSILAWETPWTEEPGGLRSTGSQRVGHDWARTHYFSIHTCILKQCSWSNASEVYMIIKMHVLRLLFYFISCLWDLSTLFWIAAIIFFICFQYSI